MKSSQGIVYKRRQHILKALQEKKVVLVEDLAKEVDFQQKIAELNKKLSSENENSEKYEDFSYKFYLFIGDK